MDEVTKKLLFCMIMMLAFFLLPFLISYIFLCVQQLNSIERRLVLFQMAIQNQINLIEELIDILPPEDPVDNGDHH